MGKTQYLAVGRQGAVLNETAFDERSEETLEAVRVWLCICDQPLEQPLSESCLVCSRIESVFGVDIAGGDGRKQEDMESK